MEFINDYIVLIVVAACLCVGYVIKHLVPGDAINKYIPLIVGVLGVLINVWHNGLSITPEILVGGLVSGLASTGLHQAFKQFLKNSEE